MADDLTALLAGIRERYCRRRLASLQEDLYASAEDIPRLLAAVKRVLETAAEFDVEDGYVREPAMDLLRYPVSRGDRIRAAVLRGLTGQEIPMADAIPTRLREPATSAETARLGRPGPEPEAGQ